MSNKKPVLHLVTQNDQPYGSTRKSCECCGTWILGNPANHKYCEDKVDHKKLIESGDYSACSPYENY